MHNLFGDTHAVHVTLDEQGGVVLDAVIKGDTVREVLQYVDFDTDALVSKLRTDVETRRARRPDDLRGIRPPAEVLRRGAGRVHVPGIEPSGIRDPSVTPRSDAYLNPPTR